MELDPLDKQYKYLQKEETQPATEELKKVVCPKCGHPAHASDINIQDKIAKCGSCHGVFSFQNALQSLFDNTKAKENRKTKLERQKDIDILEYKGELNISIVNFTDWTALIAFTIAIFGLLGSMIAGTDGMGMSVLPFAISSAMLMAFAIFRFVGWKKNRTFIDVDDQYLYVRNRPKHFQKDRTYAVDKIRQFYGKHMPGYDAYGPSGYFHLWMVYDGPDGEEHIKITPYLRSRSRALYLEQELEKHLGIPEREVPEEYKPIKV